MNYSGTGTRQFTFEGSSSGGDYYTSFTNQGSGSHHVTLAGKLTANAAAFATTPTVNGESILTANSGINANNINGGTLNAARLPSDVTFGSVALTSAGAYFRSPNAAATNNIALRATNGSAAGIEGQGSGGSTAFQLYGDGSNWGFLNSAWGSWDLRKANGGKLY